MYFVVCLFVCLFVRNTHFILPIRNLKLSYKIRLIKGYQLPRKNKKSKNDKGLLVTVILKLMKTHLITLSTKISTITGL